MGAYRRFFWIFLALSWRHHQKKWGRFALTLLGVVVAVAVSASIRATNDRVISSLEQTVTSLTGKANLQMTQIGGFSPEALWSLDYLWKDGGFSPFIHLTASYEGQPVQLYGFDFLSDKQIRQLEAKTSKLTPSSVLKPGLWVAPDSPLLTGEGSVMLVINGERVPFLVAGVLKTLNGRLPPRGSAFVDILQLKPYAPVTGLDIWVQTDQLKKVQKKLQNQFPAAQVVSLSKKQSFTKDLLSAFQMNLEALGLVALLVCVYLVYSSLNLAVLERKTDLNILVALGAKPRELITVLLVEGAGFGLLGGALGASLGWWLSRFSFKEVGQTVTQIYQVPLSASDSFDWQAPLLSLGLGVLSCLVASLLPAWQATRVDTASGLKAKVAEFHPPQLKKVGLLGVCGLGLSFLSIGYALKTHQPWPGFVAIATGLLGLSLLAPVGLAALAWLFRNAQGPGLLLRAFVRGNLLKLAIAIAALTVALSMAGSMSVMVQSFRATFTQWLNLTLQADLYIKSATKEDGTVGTLPPGLKTKIRSLPFVRNTLSLYLTRVRVGDREVDLGANQLLDPDFQKMIHLVRHSPNPYQQATTRPGVLISEVLAEKAGYKLGDKLPLFGQQLPIVGVFQNFSSQRGMVYLDREAYLKVVPGAHPVGMAVLVKPGTDLGRALLQLRSITQNWALRFSRSEEVRQTVLHLFERTFRITRLLEVIAFGISILAVLSTLVTLVVQRKGELALLLALGAEPKKLYLSFVGEALGLTAVALLLSVFGAGLLSWVLVSVINRFSFGWTLYVEVPWADLAEMGGLITLGAVLATLGPMKFLSQLNLATVLKAEG